MSPGTPETGKTIAVKEASTGNPPITADELNLSWRVAKALALSGMFKDAHQAEKALAKILIGRDLGLSPTQALMGIHIVEGKPEISATMLASFVRKLPGYDYKVLEHTDQRCEIAFFMDGEQVGTSAFSMEDAARAELVRPRSPWVKYPRNMLFARAISNGVKWFAPDATNGIPVYHEGELGGPAPQLTEGVSEEVAVVAPVELDPEVEAVLARAGELGHAGLSDRATAEMALAGQPAEVVAGWVREANATLDGLVPDADVVSDDSDPRAEAEELFAAAERAAEDGREKDAQRMNAEAEALVQAADRVAVEGPGV